ncbi:MAG: ATP-dependent sacrificial sulfur transferase LarE [Victivallales bacterium]|nr:ATP-dependent sacrificial sulfur transferase LarE [Victivallales bacterium]
MMEELSRAERRLFDALSASAPLAIAVSGGADSTLLAKAASIALPKSELHLLHVLLPFSPPRETRGISEWAEKESIPLEILELNLLDLEEVTANDSERCYHCKRHIVSTVLREIRSRGFANIADGTVTDDFGDYRPGLRATAELGVLHPLADSGFDKRLTRLLARRYGLPNWNLPASACLASRIPCGTPITRDALERISSAEDFLTDLGFSGCRVRHMPNLAASVEVPRPRLGRLFKLREKIEEKLKSMGFKTVELNPTGYRRGSMNLKNSTYSGTTSGSGLRHS